MIRCQLNGGPAHGRVVERAAPGPWLWVAHGPLGLLERYRRRSHDASAGVAEYAYDEDRRGPR